MDNRDERLDDIQRQLGELPQEILAAIGTRPGGEDWPAPPQSSGSSLPDVGGPAAGQFDPVIQRLEGVARMLEQRLGDQAGGWGSPPKVFEQQSLSGLIGQMPIPQAIGFADQSWGVPPLHPDSSTMFSDSVQFLEPNEKSDRGVEPREAWAAPTQPPQQAAATPSGIDPQLFEFNASTGELGVPWGQSPQPPVMPQAATSATAEGGGDVSGSLVSELQQLRQEIAELRQSMSSTGRAEPANPNAIPGSEVPGQQRQSRFPASEPSEGPAFSMPEMQPGAVPSLKDAHKGGAPLPWWMDKK